MATRQPGSWEGAVPGRSDAELVVDSLDTPALFSEIFERHAAVLHGYLAVRLGTDLADDLLSETFVAAFRRRASYDPERGEVRAWLYGIASHAIAQHRREEVRRWRLGEAIAAQPVDHVGWDEVDRRLQAESELDGLSEAIAALKPGDRDVLMLLAWEELTYEQTAAALDIPVGTVRSRMHRVRRQLTQAAARREASWLRTARGGHR